MNGLHTTKGSIQMTVLAVMLLVVQFGLVQHNIEHIPAELDIACEFCVAGHQPSAPPQSTLSVIPDAAQSVEAVPAAPRAPVFRPSPAHPPRGPPVYA